MQRAERKDTDVFCLNEKNDYRGMKNKSWRSVCMCMLAVLMTGILNAQHRQEVDGVAAVVGKNIILKSDIEQYLVQVKNSGVLIDDAVRTRAIEDMLFEKLLLHRAELDSLEVSEAQLNDAIDRRISVFERQIGSREELEKYYDKSILEIKEEMKEPLRNQILAQQARQQITSGINITPREVREFFESLPKDSIPQINDEVEIAQILKLPPPSNTAIEETKEKLRKLRQRVADGESFSTLAILYSEDPGSSRNGGEYKGIKRGQFVKEFEAVMFSLKENEISDVFKTEYGYHIVQLIERRGEEVDVRHILMSPKISPVDLNEAKIFLDSIKVIIEDEDLSFEGAAQKYSDDKETKFNGGSLINPNTGDNKFELSHLDRTLSVSIDKMNVNEISKPAYLKLPDGKEAYRLLYLRKKTQAHTANLKEDYKRIQDMTRESKYTAAMEEWIKKEIKTTYIKLTPEYAVYSFKNNWLKK